MRPRSKPGLRALACAALLSMGAAACTSSGRNDTVAEVPPVPVTNRFQLRTDLRRLWTDRVVWTRVFIIDTLAGLPDTQAATDRLLRNQDEIGNTLRPFYGDVAADQLTQLLRDDVQIAGEVVRALRDAQLDDAADADARWTMNADGIAVFLADANPTWGFADVRALMRAHLDQTAAEIRARIDGRWDVDVRTYDEVVVHARVIADTLASGIYVQHPELVSTLPAPSPDDEALQLRMRELWEDHVSWTRFFVIAELAKLPDAGFGAARLLRNQDDLGGAVKPFYGRAAGEALAALLRVHVTTAAELVDAVRDGVEAAAADASARWYANADRIAALLASVNPLWRRAELEALMRTHLDRTVEEVSARVRGDWAADVVAYDAIVEHILRVADTLSGGISDQISIQ